MEKISSDVPLDYTVFQLSPKRTRCELFVSSGAKTEKLASGLLRPFITHLKIAQEQVASAAQSFKLEVGRLKNADMWFTKGTIERFVQFVSTPEVLELVNTFDGEMSQLEAARKIYSQGAGDQSRGGGGSGVTAADDVTKKDLLRAIDLRLQAVQQDLSNACAHAVDAGFNVDSVSELQMFADNFGAHRLNEACGKFISLCERRPNLINQWKSRPEDRAVCSSSGSDMSIDDDPPSPPPPLQEPVTFPIRLAFGRDSIAEGGKPNDAVGVKDSKNESSTPDQTESIQANQPARKLSVQDRINMFENKQKENSGGKPVVVKPAELRRLSSDVSSTMGAADAEKAALRKWSGVSDTSIALSAEHKDNTESPLCNPSSSLNDIDDAARSNSIIKPETKVIPSLNWASDNRLKDCSNDSEQYSEFSKLSSNLAPGENDGSKDQVLSTTISRADNQENSEEKLKNLFGGKNESAQLEFGDHGQLKGPQGGNDLCGTQSKIGRVKDRDFSFPQTRLLGSKGGGQVDIPNQREDSKSRDDFVPQSNMKSTLKSVRESGFRIREAFAARCKGVEDDSSSAQQEVKFVGETEVVERKESQVEDSGPRRMKFSRQGSAAELGKKAKFKADESGLRKISRTPFSGKITTEAQEVFDSFTTPPPEQVQRARQSKGNQELNDELKMKENELEKLFAEHKLRAPGDQFNSISPQLSENYQLNRPIESSKNKIKSKKVDSQNYGDDLNKEFSEISVSEGSRGKLYDKYIQKRDAKLKEDWSSNREEKEARLKSMQDSLERSRSEMKAKFSGSEDTQDSVSSARRRAERDRPYNGRAIMNRQQQFLDFDIADDEEALDLEDGISRGSQGKKLLPNNRNLSSTHRVPKSATKTPTNSVKKRTQPENPLAQSVPNFSDLRKENTKPSSGGSKTSSRSQVRNYARSKSTTNEAGISKEDKSRRLRKSSANQSDSRETSPLHSDGVVLTPIKFDEEVQKSVGTKTFLKKGSRTVRQRASDGSEHVNNVDDNDMASGPDDFESIVKDERVEEIETFNTEELMIVNSESENGDGTLAFSRADQALGSQLPIGSIQDWPGESLFSYPHKISDVDAYVDSPVGSPSWNSSHSFSQLEADAARMRKKWGTAQKPVLVSHLSSNLARKDMTRGFKRFLKFGRKNRGSESLADWVSVTTSEGDDDMEDGRDIANRLSEDLRKSRMGFSQAQPCDDGFNGSEFFNESVQSSESSIPVPPSDLKLRVDHISGTSIKAPRSFFSLATFLSKGSESKPR